MDFLFDSMSLYNILTLLQHHSSYEWFTDHVLNI